ncbi:hypothetical protein G6F32_014284 [Rhizopus arrhizus]|nr:hypothetical protein G6F32_014284 [Rhizopus arrhizus]
MSDELTRELGEQMQVASEALEFEQAARLRDLISSLRSMQTRQYVDGRAADLDVLAVAMQGSQACVLLLACRDGRNLGTRPLFPRTNREESPEEGLAAFVAHFEQVQVEPGGRQRDVVHDAGAVRVRDIAARIAVRLLVAGAPAAFPGGVRDIGRGGLHGDGEAMLAGAVELHMDAGTRSAT